MKLAMFSSSKIQKGIDKDLEEIKNNIYRCAVYVRVSTDKEEQKSSIENQKELFIQLANEKGWGIFDFYIDIESGTKDTKRSGLQRLISDARLKKFDLVVSKEIARLSRNGALSYTLRDTLLENKIDIITLDGAIDTTSGNMELFGLYVWMAEQESQRTSNRIKSMFETKANKGHFIGSNPPYGYNVVNKRLIIKDDDTPTIVKRIFHEYLEGKGFDSIARGLYNDSIPTPAQTAGRKNYSDKWHGSTIRKILTNPHYTGMLLQLRDTKPSVTSKRILNSQEETVLKEDTHEAIIPLDVFKAVQNQIIARQRIRPQQEVNLFTNTAFCADCGRGMHFKKNRKGYVCGNYNKHGNKACSEHFIKEAELADIILLDINSKIAKLDLDNYLTQTINEKINNNASNAIGRLENIRRTINKLNKKKVSLTKQFVSEDKENTIISDEVYKLTIKDINNEINELITKKRELEDSNSLMEIDMDIIKKDIYDLISLKQLSSEMLHRFVSRIEIHSQGSPKIIYRF